MAVVFNISTGGKIGIGQFSDIGLRFNGISDLTTGHRLELPNYSAIDFATTNNAYSVAINFIALRGDVFPMLISHINTANNNKSHANIQLVDVSSTTFRIQVYKQSSGFTTARTAGTFLYGVPYFLVHTSLNHLSANELIYVDSVLQECTYPDGAGLSSGADISTQTTDPWILGLQKQNTTQVRYPFKGYLFSCQIFNKVLTLDETRAMKKYDGFVVPASFLGDCKANLQLNEGSGIYANDLAVVDKVATLVNYSGAETTKGNVDNKWTHYKNLTPV